MIREEIIEYTDGIETYQGFLAYDDQISELKPLVMVVHAYKGLLDFEKKKAVELAKMGFVGFAVDLYGKGRRGNSVQEGRVLMAELNSDRALLLKRMQLALDQAKKIEHGDANQIAAIGFCFGGKCCLDLVRSGEEIRGTAIFHGVFDKPEHVETQEIKSKVLVLHGYDDPLAEPEAMIELCDELTQAKAQWEVCAYGHTGHAFTNPEAKSAESGMFYSEIANERSWNRLTSFFNEIFVNT